MAAPSSCPLCGGRSRCSSDEFGMKAWTFVKCTACGLFLKGSVFHIYYNCLCSELRRQRQNTIAKWNRRTN